MKNQNAALPFFRAFVLLVLPVALSLHSALAVAQETALTKGNAKRVAKDELSSAIEPAEGIGETKLHLSVFAHDQAKLEQLLKDGADVNAESIYQVSPLSLACEVGNADAVKSCLAAGANVESKRMGGERPLMIASRLGDAKIVEMLIKADAQLDAKEARGQTSLMWSAAEGHAKVVDQLLKAGAQIEVESKNGFTAFMFAARQGHGDVVLRFLEEGVNVNSILKSKRTGGRNPRSNMSALLLAVESGHFELALELVDRGADPNDQRSGFAALHAVSWVRKTKVGDDPEGDPAPRGSGVKTSLQFVRELIAKGADCNLQLTSGSSKGKAKRTSKGATPFLYASATADLPMMQLLIELGADPMINDADGCTPLMAAAGVGVVAVGEEPGTEDEVVAAINYLSELGLDCNVVDKNGETAMHGAGYRNHPRAVDALAALGADPVIWNTKNKHGWTPKKIAQGYRPGSFKPSPDTIAALDRAMKVKPESKAKK